MSTSFSGFSKEGIKFLRDLGRNNTRDWFNKNKKTYEAVADLRTQKVVASREVPGAQPAMAWLGLSSMARWKDRSADSNCQS